MVHDSLVYQSSSSTVAEAVIQRTIKGIQTLMDPQYNKNISQRFRDKEEEGQSAAASSSAIEINPAAKDTGNCRYRFFKILQEMQTS
jgi:hypothetical protein